jgi:oligoribonuclease (3'-5' exoribonuclease)
MAQQDLPVLESWVGLPGERLTVAGGGGGDEDCEAFLRQYPPQTLRDWRSARGSRHSGQTLLHVFAPAGFSRTVAFLIGDEVRVDPNVQRQSDRCTAFHLVCWSSHGSGDVVVNQLLAAGVDQNLSNSYGETAGELLKTRESRNNIVWMDLELTNLPFCVHESHPPFQVKPRILECAVIITDAKLNEIARGEWIVRESDEVLANVSSWVKSNCGSVESGGNGLLSDVLASKISPEQFEKEVVALITKHCPKGYCPLAGSSIHNDKGSSAAVVPDDLRVLQPPQHRRVGGVRDVAALEQGAH